MEKREVSVTEEDIKNGKRGSPSSCPIALAMKRTFPGYEVAVNRNAILLESLDRELFCNRLTSLAQYKFVRRFDNGKSVHPFSFDFEDPSANEAEKVYTAEEFQERLGRVREKALNR